MITSQTTEVMTQLRALQLAVLAIDYLLTGAPALDTFDLDEVDQAFKLLFEQKRARKGQRRHPDRTVLDTAQGALRSVYFQLEGYSRGVRGRQQRECLQTAKVELPAIIARVETKYNQYWADFTASVLAEADTIIKETQR